MPSVEARLATDRPSRYLEQFCRHASVMGDGAGRTHRGRPHAPERSPLSARAEWSQTRGVVTFNSTGRCTLTTGTGVLIVRIEADDADGLRLIQCVVTDDFARFGRREGVTLDWQECT
jgi:hypothetical protein